jgi:hypothetical protein
MGIMMMMVSHASAIIPGAKHVQKWKWGAQALGGLSKGVGFGLAGLYGYYNYGHKYGTGVTAIYAAASLHPVTNLAVSAIEGVKILGDMAYKKQQSKIKSSFAKNTINDKFGTIQAMRQFSGQQIRRDHTAVQRVLGNEAFYLHR